MHRPPMSSSAQPAAAEASDEDEDEDEDSDESIVEDERSAASPVRRDARSRRVAAWPSSEQNPPRSLPWPA